MDPLTIAIGIGALFGFYEYSKHSKAAAAKGTVVRPATPAVPTAPPVTAPIAPPAPSGVGVVPTPPPVYPGFVGLEPLRSLATGTVVNATWAQSIAGSLPMTGDQAHDDPIGSQQMAVQGIVMAGTDPGAISLTVGNILNAYNLPAPSFKVGDVITVPSSVLVTF
jgi:hypothetical protein